MKNVSFKNRNSTQRERLVAGMIAAVNRQGYAGASVSAVIAHAGVSRPTFYDHFADRADCFLAAHRDVAQELLQEVELAVTAAAPACAVQTGVRALVEFAAAQPERARLLIGETLAGGPPTLDARDRTIVQLGLLIERAELQAPVDAATPDISIRALLGAVHWLLAPPLRRREHDLSRLARDLADWIESYLRPTSEHRWRTIAPGPALAPTAHKSELSLHPPAPLPPGRSRLSADEITRNHRERILYATAQLAAHKGYTATTIADIAARAALDRRVFYARFRDKQEAFLAVHELAGQQMLAVIAGAFFSAPTWPERVWEGLRAAGQFQADHPVFAHMGLVESHAVGAPAVQRIDDSRAAFTIFLQEGLQQTARPPSRTAQEAIAAAIFEIGYYHARNGQSQLAPRFVCHPIYVCLAPFLGPRAASEFIDGKLSASGDDGPATAY
ncbi:MAG TPA: TetR/AcrR family transcriptional regulator [Solirubrobacteraceae bacterium]|jgi:AcrR family transcriptional regulator